MYVCLFQICFNPTGQPISVSCAYNGRVAIAYRQGRVRTFNDNPANKFVNLYVSIYECESTGMWWNGFVVFKFMLIIYSIILYCYFDLGKKFTVYI